METQRLRLSDGDLETETKRIVLSECDTETE